MAKDSSDTVDVLVRFLPAEAYKKIRELAAKNERPAVYYLRKAIVLYANRNG